MDWLTCKRKINEHVSRSHILIASFEAMKYEHILLASLNIWPDVISRLSRGLAYIDIRIPGGPLNVTA